MKTVLCRHGYCPICEREKRPHRGSLFLAYGSYRGAYYVREAMRDGTAGFTPHLFILNQVTKDHVCIVSMVCSMYDCGVEKITRKEKCLYGVKQDSWQTIFMPIEDWNALVTFKREKQYQV